MNIAKLDRPSTYIRMDHGRECINIIPSTVNQLCRPYLMIKLIHG
uniref:Uncharacterized protein n=1 Tax=Anguilla anguilla TaxID=7936 RepID=A0A0E9P5G0_ANGAN